jgi:hypothetical protein
VPAEGTTIPEGLTTTTTSADSGAGPTTTVGPGDPAVSTTPTTVGDGSTQPGETTTTTVRVEPAGSTGDEPTVEAFRVLTQTLGTPCDAGDRRVTLGWDTSGADTVTISGPGASSVTRPPSGQTTVCRPQGDPVTYTLTATGPGGTTTRTTTV